MTSNIPARQAPFEPGLGGRFLGIFLLLFLGATLLPDGAIHLLNTLTASFSALLLQASGLPAIARGEFLSLDSFNVEIVPECTALYLAILFGSFVLAYPATVGKKVLGLAGGSALLFLVNAARISTVVYVGRFFPAIFHILHAYLGQILMMLLVLGLCLGWVRWHEDKDQTSNRRPEIAWWRFVLLSGGLFILWLAGNKAYVAINDGIAEWFMARLGYMVTLKRSHPIYFETFNLPFFIGLILATRPLPWKTKARGLLGGMLLVWTGHILFRIGNIVLMLHQEPLVFQATNALVILSQYLLPVLAWFAVARSRSALLPQQNETKVPRAEAGERDGKRIALPNPHKKNIRR